MCDCSILEEMSLNSASYLGSKHESIYLLHCKLTDTSN